MKFGDNLKNLRKSKKLSQEVLAEKVGVSRQSVSKWETGEAYPEMNNILMLCKIFHCNINELVNDSLMDVNSLDEEIKMNVVKFKEEKQRKVKGISKAIYLTARIIQCLVGGAIAVLILFMVAVPFLLNRVKMDEEKIEIFGSDYSYRVEENLFILDDYKIEIPNSINIKEYLLNHSTTYHILSTEYVLLCLVVSLGIFFLLFRNIEKLFLNIHRENTPFTLENVSYIKRIALLLVLFIVIPNVTGLLFELVAHINMEIELEISNLLLAFIAVSIAYIFEYGYELQLDSKGKIYG